MRKLLRAIILAVIACFALGQAAVLVIEPHAITGGIFGWDVATDGVTVVHLTPGGPAQRAGVRVGDRIEWRQLPILGRQNLAIPLAAELNSSLKVTLDRGTRRIALTLRPAPWTSDYITAVTADLIANTVLILIGVAIVWMRPSRMTWRFLTAFLTTYFISRASVTAFVVQTFLTAIVAFAANAGILIFASRFPGDRPRGPLIVIDRLAIPLGSITGALVLLQSAIMFYAATPPPEWLLITNHYLINVVVAILAIASLAVAYSVAKGSDRQRIVPVLAAFALLVASTTFTQAVGTFITDPAIESATNVIQFFATVALGIAFSYGVLRHRVVDVSFAISRTLVYTMLTSIIVGVFVLIDFVSSKVLDRLQFAVALEACLRSRSASR